MDISDDMFILKAEDAQKLKEPPRLAQLVVRPADAIIKPGDQVSFTCTGLDQYGQPFPIPAVKWSAPGGSVGAGGLYTAGKTGGLFTARAEAGGVEAVVEVRVTTADVERDGGGDGGRPALPGQSVIRWRGSVPPQKWVTFYTKVLSRFATASNLKLEVSFEAPVERSQAQTKLGDTKSGLKELGLDEAATVG